MNVLKLSDFSEKIQKGFIENEEINVNEVKRIINENFKKSLISEELFCDSMDIVDSFEKARKKAEIGEVRNFGGRDYVKTTNGWKYKRKDSKKTTSSKKETKKDTTSDSSKGATVKSAKDILDSKSFDLSSDQKKLVTHLNESLKSFMGMNETNVTQKDIEDKMGWDSNKAHDIVGALVSKEVLEKKVVSSMDGNDYTTYHFKDQDSMVYEPSGAIAAAGLDKSKSPREAKMKSLAEEYCKRFDLKLEEMMPGGGF